MDSKLYLLFFLLRFQAEILLPVVGVVKLISHLLWLSRGPPFSGLSAECSLHYRKHYKWKKKKVKCDLAEMGMYQKELWFGLYSLHKESEEISRLQCETSHSIAQSLWRCGNGECKQIGNILMHF